MPFWNGYEQNPMAHSRWPWWVREGLTFRRADGIGLHFAYTAEHVPGLDPRGLLSKDEDYDHAMERIDWDHPLPMPDPRVGQVWAFRYADCWDFRSVVGVRAYDNGSYFIRLKGFNLDESVHQIRKDALLVSGPGSPWEWTGSREGTPFDRYQVV